MLTAAATLLGSAAVLAAAAVPGAAPLGSEVQLRSELQLESSSRFQQTHTTTSQIVGITDVVNGAERQVTELPAMHWEVVEVLDWLDVASTSAPRGDNLGTAPQVERDFTRLTRSRRERVDGSVDSSLELGTLQGLAVSMLQTENGWAVSYVQTGESGEVARPVDEAAETQSAEAESGPDPAWLSGITYHAPFAGFLPADGVAQVGDTWEADLDAWRAVLRPSGDLVYLDQSGVVVDDTIDTDLLGALKGKITCTLTGVQGDAATIAVQVRVSSRKQVEGQLDRDDPGIVTASFMRSIGLRGVYDGTLVWDMVQLRARSFDLTGKATWNIDETTLMNFENGTEWAQGKLMELAAEHTLEATLE